MMAYTYLIGWRSHDKWYYGVRYANKKPPSDDLWSSYFTSSKKVKEFRNLYGEPDVIRVHREFSDRADAIEYELRFLRRVGATRSERWLNMHITGTKWNPAP